MLRARNFLFYASHRVHLSLYWVSRGATLSETPITPTLEQLVFIRIESSDISYPASLGTDRDAGLCGIITIFVSSVSLSLLTDNYVFCGAEPKLR